MRIRPGRRYRREEDDMLKKIVLIMMLLISVNCFAEEDYRPGICPITGTRIIDDFGRPTPNYRIIWFELDNGSRMPLAVDVEAVNSNLITESDFDRIMKHVEAGWLWEISNKKWTPQEIQRYKDNFFGLSIVRIIK